MSHLFDFLCKSSEENEDFGSFMEFSDDMKNLDIPLTLEAPDLMSSEFFDSVLSMEQDSFTPTIDNDLMNICSDFDAQSPRSSDCGDSVTLGSDSGSSTKGSDDMLNINEIFTLPPTESNLDSGDIMFNPQQTKLVVQQNPKRVIFSKPIQNSSNKGIKNKQQIIRVQSISGNGRSLLLPVNVKNVKKIKIINANDLKMENIKVTGTSNIFKKIEKVDTSDDEDDIQPPQQNTSRFPPLHLTNEEKRLLVKEGIKLPTHYPLSKNEEKELKRIRRKIRNKISAQDSRKRKKEYVDKLEEKAKRTTEENEFLKKRIKLLRKQNSKLMEQMRKLQTVLFKTTSTSTKATPTTCLMIVLFSTLLVCLPNLRLSEKQELGEQHLFAARRALLFNQKANEEDVNMDEFLVFNKDDESELESFVDEESENASPDNEFASFLSELAKKYENIPMDKNCSEMTAGNNGNGNLGEFCRKYEDEIKNVIHSMKEFLDTDAAKVGGLKEKGFIEPDISDDEEFGKAVKWSSIKEEPPSKRMKIDDDLLVNFLDTKQE